jgi:signal peptidase I
VRKLGRFLLWTAIIGGAVVGIARATTLRWYRVPDGDPVLTASLSPNLRAGDLILLWRLTAPDVGDLVMCPDPQMPSRIVVGRVMGEEGERVRVEGTDVYVNAKRLATERACDAFSENDPNSGLPVQQSCSEEVLRGRTHRRGASMKPPSRAVGDTDREVPEGKVYLVSDNRHFPYDSRDYGAVDRAGCKEFVFFRLVGKGGWSDADARFTYIH